MSDRLKVLLQYVLPKQRLTVFAGRIAGAHGGSMTTRLIRWFVEKYEVDMSEASDADIDSYKSFNDFFTRALKPGLRPLATGDSSARSTGRSANSAPSTIITCYKQRDIDLP